MVQPSAPSVSEIVSETPTVGNQQPFVSENEPFINEIEPFIVGDEPPTYEEAVKMKEWFYFVKSKIYRISSTWNYLVKNIIIFWTVLRS